MKRLFRALPLFSVALTACGGAAVPQEALTAAKASVQGAEVAGAASEPKAALHLKLAKEQITKAEALIEDGDNEEAAVQVDRAQADADLSMSLAKEAKAKLEASETKEQLERLKKNVQ
ncbi:MAG TPA: DUF4398 domain-containing protein [Polyangiaceae bacterium]